MTFYDDPFMSTPDSDGGLFSPAKPGIGMSSPTDDRRALIAQMSPARKIFSALGEFGAGVTGRPSPLQAQVDRRRKEKLLKLEETKGFLADLQNLGKLTENMEEGPKNNLIKTIADKWEAVAPGYGEAVKAIGARPSLLKSFDKYLPYLPAPVQDIAKRDPNAFFRWAGTTEGVKTLNQAADQPALRLAGRRRDAVIMGWQKFATPEQVKKFNEDGVLTDAEIMQMQGSLPEKLRFTDEEREAIKRNPVFWEGTGVLHGDKASEVLADRAKKAGKGEGPQSDLGKLKADLDAGRITPAEYEAKKKKLTHIPAGDQGGTGIPKGVLDAEFKISDDYARDSKKFSERRPLFDSSTDYMAQRLKGGKTSSGDAALLFAYAKMRDPNDRIAVAEIKDLHKLGNIFERFEVNLVGILEKGETLPDRVAKEMYAEIRRAFTEQNRQQAKIEKAYRKKVSDYKGDPDRAITPYAIPDEVLNRTKDEPKGGTQDFADPGAVKAAYDAGKITREQAKEALKKFGFN